MHFRKYFLVLFACLCSISSVLSQNYSLKIRDQQGAPVAFATLKDIHAKEIVVADAEGNLYYSLYTERDSLQIQSMGFTTQVFILERTMKGPITITLAPSFNEISAVEVSAVAVNAFGFNKNTISASSMYLDKKSLSKIESNDIHQVLYAVPGVQIQQEDGFGLRPNIGMRGTGVERSSKITLLEDGVLIAPAPYAASAAYYFPSMENIESIEVLKGSSQIAYGPQTNGGAINLITDRIPNDFSGNVRFSLGSFLTRKVQASLGGSEQNVGYFVKASYFGSNGFKTLPNNENTGFNKGNVLAKLRFNTNPDAKIFQSFTVKYAYTQELSNETYLGITLDDFETDPLQRYAASAEDFIKTSHSQIQLNHIIQPIKNMKISTTVYLNKFDRNWFKLDKVAADGTTKVGIVEALDDPNTYAAELALIKGSSFESNNRLFLRNNNRMYTSKGIQSALYYNFTTKQVKHGIQAGIRLHADEMDRFQWDDVYTMTAEGMQLFANGIPGTESNRIESAKAFSAYAQYLLQYKKLSIHPGVRYELMQFNLEDFGKADTARLGTNLLTEGNKNFVFLPGVTINYQVKNQNHIFVGAHKGFSPANFNPETLPEESWNVELGGKGVSKGFSYEAVGFANFYENLLGNDLAAGGGTGSTELFNGGKVRVFGFESMLAYNILAKFSDNLRMPLVLSYTFTDAEFLSDFESDGPWGLVSKGDQLPYISKHQIFAQLGLEHKKFEINLMSKLLTTMRTSPSQGDLVEAQSTPLFYQLDLLARYQVQRYVSVFTKFNNLTNNVQRVSAHPSGWRPNMPFYVEGGVSLSF